MIRRPPRSTLAKTLLPYTTICRTVIEKDDKNSNNTGENTKVTLEDGKTLPNAIQSEAQAKAKSDKYSTTYDTATLNSAIGIMKHQNRKLKRQTQIKLMKIAKILK